jgi:hypothetical protein
LPGVVVTRRTFALALALTSCAYGDPSDAPDAPVDAAPVDAGPRTACRPYTDQGFEIVAMSRCGDTCELMGVDRDDPDVACIATGAGAWSVEVACRVCIGAPQ